MSINCTNEEVKQLDNCQREQIKGCDGCPDHKVDAYATKYKECRLCGTEADCTYISQDDGLCMSCRSNEEYNEHEHRVSGD